MRNIFFYLLLVFFFSIHNINASTIISSSEPQEYNATITRDIWGVPHIHGKRDADTAFGLAFAHAQDDIKNIVENMYFYRARMGLKDGFKGITTDYLIKALGIREMVVEDYESKLSSDVRAVIEGYAAGLNYWASWNPNQQYSELFPVTKYDIVAGFVIQNLFFSGVIDAIRQLQEAEGGISNQKTQSSNDFLESAELILGSNAIAVGPKKTDDGSTRLIINSHQPLEGPVAWYEAHVTSEQGWNMMGGLFPGSPFIFVGFNDNLGWGFTVNKPDLSDVYQLKIHPKNNNQYLLDGEWVNFKVKKIQLPFKLFGPFKWTITKQIKYSVHGPVIENNENSYAIRFSGMQDIGQVEQWYRLNKSKNIQEWLAAMKIRSIVSFNVIYADKEKNILFLHNAASPIRDESIDWSKPVDGSQSSLIWNKLVALEELPLIINPSSGWLVSANQDPFKVTAEESNLDPLNYSKTLGLQTRMTNRAHRALELFNSFEEISSKILLDIKYDNQYSLNSRSYGYIEKILKEAFDDPQLIEAQSILRNWDLKTGLKNRSAALAVCVLTPEWSAEQNQKTAPDPIDVFKNCVKDIYRTFKRLDPLWEDRNVLMRGDKMIPLDGGPDTLRAVYGTEQKNGKLKAVAGDGLVIFVEWDKDGNLESKSIHQYGSSTQNEHSNHYDDQMLLFADKKMKDTYFDSNELYMHTENKMMIPLEP